MDRQLSEYSDGELYALLHTDESETAFAELYTRYAHIIYAYCLRVMADREKAHDIFQDTFMRFFQSAERHVTIDNVKGYILTISRNLCLNEKKRVQAQMVEFDDMLYNPGLSREAERTEMLKLIAMAIELLPHDMREAFVLREYQGLPYSEITVLLNIKVETAKVRVFRARQRIKEILEPYLNELNSQ
jgi:RNA polymerase sigma-70 factor (ECF subfamily)